MLQDPRLENPGSSVAKKFKRRFRFAYPEQYNQLKVNRNKHYGLQIKEGWILDCFDNAISGKCIASMANDATNCINITTNKRAVNNCRVSLKHSANVTTVTLVCDKDN